ncbi:hypothetical protein [Saccharopolyspora phatthalungensis]|uniref:Transmembrane protein n=1 Tax=Saccharopolyspora phatthalungensis TaxID=664693 RepID=A0A840QK42_9PSEU|nr:hypothetical protein [Saccharopolyspora phatthalungensis]MBB5159908.1 hypothetical protein [Saccharopolyspora phatthalungensis]
MTVAYLLNSVAWSLAGFLLGLLLGQLGRAVQDLEEVVAVTHKTTPPSRRRRPLLTWERAAGIVAVLSAVTLVTAATSAYQLQQKTEFQTRYNVALRNLLESRTQANQRVRDAQAEFIAALAAPNLNPRDPALRTALDRYHAALEADRAEHARVPVPEAPDC